MFQATKSIVPAEPSIVDESFAKLIVHSNERYSCEEVNFFSVSPRSERCRVAWDVPGGITL